MNTQNNAAVATINEKSFRQTVIPRAALSLSACQLAIDSPIAYLRGYRATYQNYFQ